MYKLSRSFCQKNAKFERTLKTGTSSAKYYSLPSIGDPKVATLPFSIRVLLENALRNYDDFVFTSNTLKTIIDWKYTSAKKLEIPFKPSRVLLQDFTGVPAVVDLASMRETVKALGVDPKKINPLCPVELVIDHSVQVDVARTPDARRENERIEFARNKERFAFLKWGQKAFENLRIVPPGNGIVHQVNLEYLARVVFKEKGILYPDSVVGTDSHTTMINGLGVVGWGVGGIEGEAVMLGQHISMVLPEVVGVKLTGKLRPHVTATDLVLTLTEMLRKRGVVGKFVEFFGSGVSSLTVEDRSTIANMAPEYGATIGYFPVDEKTFDYLLKTGRSKESVQEMENYLRENMMLRDYIKSDSDGLNWTGNIMELDLNKVEPCLAGPKRPQDKVLLSNVSSEFKNSITAKVGPKGFGMKKEHESNEVKLKYKGKEYTLNNGSVVISAITSCTNTSNPEVLIGAGLLAKKAVEKGLKVAPYIKTSLSPGSGVVEDYLNAAGLLKPLEELGYYIAGLGCMTCIGNSGDLDIELANTLKENQNLIVAAVLSGNRNFEGRVHPATRANYLASPPLCVAYAIAGNMMINFDKDPLGTGKDGKPVYLKDIWPSRQEIREIVDKHVGKKLFEETYQKLESSNENWNKLQVEESVIYKWDPKSTYIRNPPFFKDLKMNPQKIEDIKGARVLLNLGDSITTDHISPAGKIAGSSSAAKYLFDKGVSKADFNSYGSRRGNFEVMARGTFANIRLVNKLVKNAGPTTIHFPSGIEGKISEIAQMYIDNKVPSIIFAGQEYGSGSSRDWAAKGVLLLGVKAVIAQSYERIHRSNLIGMGILPLEFLPNENATTLNLDMSQTYDISLNEGNLEVQQKIVVKCSDGKSFETIARIDTPIEVDYFKQGGILQYVLRNLAKKN